MTTLDRSGASLPHPLPPPIGALARAHRRRDPDTCTHQQRTAELAVAIGAILDLSSGRLDTLRIAATMHDVGKLGLPRELIGRPGTLSQSEYALLQNHCAIGHDVLQQLRAPFPVAEIVFQHHERLDGSGYPRGLKGSAILEEARILAVADTVDAMLFERPYRTPSTEDCVLGELQKVAGRTLDRDAVDACTRYVRSGRTLAAVRSSHAATYARQQ
jgi:HD-GYP domain-containing protein (c-di-GMP phosphodiesterase class II)